MFGPVIYCSPAELRYLDLDAAGAPSTGAILALTELIAHGLSAV